MSDTDLVLEGGGVKGIALVGAIAVLAELDTREHIHLYAGSVEGALISSIILGSD